MIGSPLLISVLFVASMLVACGSASSNVVPAVDRQPKNAPETGSAKPPPGCEEFQLLVDTTYTFKPSKLTPDERTSKSNAMDVVWEKVKADRKLIPCLRSRLGQPNANNFFLFDGSNLLFSLDKSDESKKILIASYARTDLVDVDVRTWIAYLLMFGLEGFDTSSAAETWLKANDPFYYLPQHGTVRVDKRIGALAIYGSMEERFATPALAEIANQKDHPGRDIAADLLVMQVTPEAAALLMKIDRTSLAASVRDRVKNYVNNPSFILPRVGPAKASREKFVTALDKLGKGEAEEFMSLVSEVPDGEKDAIVVLRPEDIPLVRKARRFYASTGTPHAPDWYQSFTDILMYMVRKPEVDRSKTDKN